MSKYLRGTEPMLAAIRKIKDKFPNKVAAAMYQKAQVLMTEAKRRTPVLTGALRASGHVLPPERSGTRVSVKLVFGGPAADYAVPVHENLTAFHKVGQAKYLESVLNEAQAEAGPDLAVQMHFDRKDE